MPCCSGSQPLLPHGSVNIFFERSLTKLTHFPKIYDLTKLQVLTSDDTDVNIPEFFRRRCWYVWTYGQEGVVTSIGMTFVLSYMKIHQSFIMRTYTNTHTGI